MFVAAVAFVLLLARLFADTSINPCLLAPVLLDKMFVGAALLLLLPTDAFFLYYEVEERMADVVPVAILTVCCL